MSDSSPHFQIGSDDSVGPEPGDFKEIDNEVIEWDAETSSWKIRGTNAVSCMVYNSYSENNHLVVNAEIDVIGTDVENNE